MYPHSLLGELGKINGQEILTLYGVCIAIGIVMCIVVLRKAGKFIGIDAKFLDFAEMNGYAAILIGFFGAALFQSIYDYIENPAGGFSLSSGLTFLGGLIGGVSSFIIIYLFFKYKGKNKLTGRITDILPVVPCCITIAHGFGRLGCFFAGCCHGKATESWLGMTFHPDSPVYYYSTGNVYPQKVLPTNLFESIFLFTLFGIMLYLLLKRKFKYNFVVYVASYGLFRFFIEFIRGDSRGELLGILSPSQTWSIVMVLGAIPLYFALKKLYELRDAEKALQVVQNAE